MPIVVEEKFNSRPSIAGQGAQVELLYTVRGTSSDLAAKVALINATPDEYDGLQRKSVEIEPAGIQGAGGEPNVWDGVVRYGPFELSPTTGESTFNFDTGGGSQHITQSLGTVGTYAAPGTTAPYFGNAIGVTSDGVDGVDITVPVYNFAETHYVPASLVTLGYRATLFNLTGKVNNAPFKGLDTGECLFLGASGSKRGQDDWEITFRFAGSPNRSGLVVANIAGIFKGGWDYLWVRYADKEDSAAKMLVKRPIAVYVERVYDWGNFAALGIGT
jgi:hypothetical protein